MEVNDTPIIDETMTKMKLIFPLMAKIKELHRGVSWVGTVTCPVCGGKLHLRHAGYNGHVWGLCETEDCVSWAE